MPLVFTGIDIGCHFSVVASSDEKNPLVATVDTNALSNRATPSLVGFDGRVRVVGEAADARINAIADSVFTHIPLILGADSDALQKVNDNFHLRYTLNDNGSAIVYFNDEEIEVHRTLATATLIRELAGFSVQPRNNTLDNCKAAVCIAALNVDEDLQCKDVLSAARLAGLKHVSILRQSDAYTNYWMSKNLPAILKDRAGGVASLVDSPLLFAVFDCGLAHSTCQMVLVSGNKVEGSDEVTAVAETLSVETGPFLGTGRLVDILVSLVPQAEKLPKSSKQMSRLRAACSRTLKELSGGTKDANVELEGFPDEDHDLKRLITREGFETAAQVVADEISTLVKKSIEASWKTGKLNCSFEFLGIELVGGGSRIPVVQSAVTSAVSSLTEDHASASCIQTLNAREDLLRKTLDGSSAAALGATLFAAGERFVKGLRVDVDLSDGGSDDMDGLNAVEQKIRAVEDAETERRFACNSLESLILETQNKLASKDGHLLGDAVSHAVTEADEWFLSQDINDISKEILDSKRNELDTLIKTDGAKYFEKLDAEKKKVEAELTAASAQRQAAEGEKEDHDFRVLPNSQRIQKASAQKDEGNELFKGGVRIELAVSHYLKALAHLAKLHDPSPVEKVEADKLAIVVHQNLAMCYLKVEDEKAFNKAVAACDAALAIDPKAVKALFRRATAREKLKDFDGSLADLVAANEVDPEDQAVQKALTRMDAFVKARLEKQKKVYGKMFGSK